MLDEAIKTKLRDPAYLDLHMAAVSAIRTVGLVDWYDSHFVRRFEVAKRYLTHVQPNAVESFVRGFDLLLPPAGFQPAMLDHVFDEATRAQIVDISRSVPRNEGAKKNRFELEQFGRHVIWDHPFFVDLQGKLLETVSAIAGRQLIPRYNFLSLYGGAGRCDPHMDEPISMFTLDYCIEQSEEWPIWFSKVVDWPTIDVMKAWDPEAIKADESLQFAPEMLKPNQAVVFNGSSQWHYRDSITPGGHCSLLFFHYFPVGAENLVEPSKWPRYFDIPELSPLCELFSEAGKDGLM